MVDSDNESKSLVENGSRGENFSMAEINGSSTHAEQNGQENNSYPVQNDNLTDIKTLASLMPDWCNPKRKNYDWKHMNSAEFKTLLLVGERNFFAVACLRILYFCFYNTKARIMINEGIICFLGENPPNRISEIREILELKNKHFRDDLLKLVVVHWMPELDKFAQLYRDTQKSILDVCEKMKPWEKMFFEMVFFLHEKLTDSFDMKLNQYLDLMDKIFGDFSEHLIKPDIALLLVIMKRNRMYKTMIYLYAQTSYFKINTPIIQKFQDAQEHQTYILEPNDRRENPQNVCQMLQRCIKLRFYKRDVTIFENVRDNLENFKKLTPKEKEIFKSSMFGWKIKNGNYVESFLEKIIKDPQINDSKTVTSLIELTWNTFKLWEKGFIYDLVRKNRI